MKKQTKKEIEEAKKRMADRLQKEMDYRALCGQPREFAEAYLTEGK